MTPSIKPRRSVTGRLNVVKNAEARTDYGSIVSEGTPGDPQARSPIVCIGVVGPIAKSIGTPLQHSAAAGIKAGEVVAVPFD